MTGTKYITWYDDVISKEYCQYLIDKFHQYKHLGVSNNNEIKRFDELNYSRFADLYTDEVNVLANVMAEYVLRYIEDNDIQSWQFPLHQIREWRFEDFRHKCYQPDVGVFEDHVDGSNIDSKERYLVMFIYLEDGEGGETVMLDQNIAVERKAGRLLMFPPMWTYPHRANMPRGNEKNIVGSYLRFTN
jgi:prolyl 4-hydroxylase